MTEEKNATEQGKTEAAKMLERLADFFETAEVEIPEDLNVRTVYVRASIQEQAVILAGMLRGKNLLFRRGAQIGTIHPETGEWLIMDSDRFASWLPLVAGIYPFAGVNKETGQPKSCSFKAEDMRRVLRSDELVFSIPEIESINLVRLPVLRNERDERGFRKLEFLPSGYDAETKTFTVTRFRYNTKPDVHEASKLLFRILKYFPIDNRSRAVQVAAMMTIFCRGMYHGRSPLFLWSSNLPGAGKSRLADLALVPHGPAAKAGYHWRDVNETRKELDSTAAGFLPYIMFEDVILPKGMKLRSTDLNRWLTSPVWECREMHTQKKLRVEVNAATFITGTQLELDDHLGRRSLLIDLQARQRARDRVLPADAIYLADDFLRDEKIVSRVLEALAALVIWWDENNRPNYSGRPLESFESWSRLIPAIVGFTFGDCLETPETLKAGDVDTREFEILVRCLVRDYTQGNPEIWVSMTDIIRTARIEGLFPSILFEIDQIVRELESKRNFQWKSTFVPMSDIPEELKGKPVHSWTDDEKLEWAMEREPNDEGKRFQAAAWTDRSIETRWGNHFKAYAVDGQWFRMETGEYWALEKKKRSGGVGYLLKMVQGSEGE